MLHTHRERTPCTRIRRYEPHFRQLQLTRADRISSDQRVFLMLAVAGRDQFDRVNTTRIALRVNRRDLAAPPGSPGRLSRYRIYGKVQIFLDPNSFHEISEVVAAAQ